MSRTAGRLESIREHLDKKIEPAPKDTIRNLLSWFDAERRGKANVVTEIRKELERLDLITEPDFNDDNVSIDFSVVFKRKEGASQPPPDPTIRVGRLVPKDRCSSR